jgi:hypothetical protein
MSDAAAAGHPTVRRQLADLRRRIAALDHDLRLLDVTPDTRYRVRVRLRAWLYSAQTSSSRRTWVSMGEELLEACLNEIAIDLAYGQQEHHRLRRYRKDPHQAPLPDRNRILPSFWSPQPILAFRFWHVGRRLRGVRGPWTEPVYVAECEGNGYAAEDPNIPHTDGSCGPYGCGLYGLKDATDLFRRCLWPRSSASNAYGVVELSGKVVEHEQGYRAARARAVAIAVTRPDMMIRVEGQDHLQRLFAAPQQTIAEIIQNEPLLAERWQSGTASALQIIDYLNDARERRLQQGWLESGNGDM